MEAIVRLPQTFEQELTKLLHFFEVSSHKRLCAHFPPLTLPKLNRLINPIQSNLNYYMLYKHFTRNTNENDIYLHYCLGNSLCHCFDC